MGLAVFAHTGRIEVVDSVFDAVCRYFFCEKCFLCSCSDEMEVVDNPTQPPMYVFEVFSFQKFCRSPVKF